MGDEFRALGDTEVEGRKKSSKGKEHHKKICGCRIDKPANQFIVALLVISTIALGLGIWGVVKSNTVTDNDPPTNWNSAPSILPLWNASLGSVSQWWSTLFVSTVNAGTVFASAVSLSGPNTTSRAISNSTATTKSTNKTALVVKQVMGTSDYSSAGQTNTQFKVQNNLGFTGSKSLEFGLLDNGVGVIQANEPPVSYNPLQINPLGGNVGIGLVGSLPTSTLQVNGTLTCKSISPVASGVYSLGNSTNVFSSVYAASGVFSGSVTGTTGIFNSVSLTGSLTGTSATLTGSLGVGTASPTGFMTISAPASAYYALAIQGTMATLDGSSTIVGITLSTTMFFGSGSSASSLAYGILVTPPVSIATDISSVYTAYVGQTIYINGANKVTNYYGLSVAAGTLVQQSGSGGSVTNAYGLWVANPGFGTNRYAAYFGGMVGINGISSYVFLYISGTLSLADGSGQTIAFYVDTILTGTTASTYMYTQFINPRISPVAGATIGTAAGLFIYSGSYGSSGTITNSYGLYVMAPSGGTNKYAAYFGGTVGIGITTPNTAYSLEIQPITSTQAFLLHLTGTIHGLDGGTAGSTYGINFDSTFSIPAGATSAYVIGFTLAPSLTSTSNVNQFFGMYVYNALTLTGSAGSPLLTQYVGVYINGGSLSGGGGVTTAYGLYVASPAFGTNRYAAFFGNVTCVVGCYPGATTSLQADSTANRILFVGGTVTKLDGGSAGAAFGIDNNPVFSIPSGYTSANMYSIYNVPVITMNAHVNQIIGMYSYIVVQSSSYSVDNVYGLLIESASLSSTVTSLYGLYVNTQSGATNNYAAYFGGLVVVGSPSPTTPTGKATLFVRDTAGNTAITMADPSDIYPIMQLYAAAHDNSYLGFDWFSGPNGILGHNTAYRITKYASQLYFQYTSGSQGAAISSAVTLMLFQSTGAAVTFNPTSTNTQIVSITGTLQGGSGSDQTGLALSPTFSPTTATITNSGMRIDITSASSYSSTYLVGINIASISLQTSTVRPTNAYGLYVNVPTAGTNNYAAFFGGNVGIGTATPGYTLDVSGTARVTGYTSFGSGTYPMFQIATVSSDNVILFFDSYYDGSNIRTSSTDVTPWRIQKTGSHLQIQWGGTGAAGSTFNVATAMAFTTTTVFVMTGIVTTSYAFYLSGQGYATGGFYATSDRQYKTNIIPIDHAMEKINQLTGVYFDWNTAAYPDHNFRNETNIGIIAQDLEQVFPEVVQTDLDGSKSVSYGFMVAPLIEATKELYRNTTLLQSQVANLTSQISSLKTQNTLLLSSLCTINASLPICI